MKNKGKILAIDFGQSKVGLAVSDVDRKVVFPRGIIKNYKNLANLFSQIQVLCENEHIDEIVFGLPFGEGGISTVQSERLWEIALKLREFLKKVRIHFVDESFTTFEAGRKMIEMPKGLKKKAGGEDDLAAVAILEKYLKEAF